MATIVLVGAFGQRNPGDEALCGAFCRALAGHHLRVASADPAGSRARFGIDAFPATAAMTARAVSTADAVVVGGGTVFKRLPASSGRPASGLLVRTAALVEGCRARGVPVALVGVGAGDLRGRSAKALSAWIARRVDLLVLRDEESAAVLTGAGVQPPFWVAADAVWRDAPLEPPSRPPPEAGRRRLLVGLSHLASPAAGPSAGTERLAAALASLGDDWDVVLQPWQTAVTADDRPLARQLLDAVPHATVVDAPRDFDAAITAAADADVVLGMRFHSVIAAGAARTRFVAVAHEPKLAAAARRLDQQAVPPHAAPSVLAAAIEAAAEGDPPAEHAIAGERVAAEVAFDLLALMLEDGALPEPAQLRGLELSSGGGTW
jgi:polysaccharide pyruvyl transferase WcaK-like protein